MRFKFLLFLLFISSSFEGMQHDFQVWFEGSSSAPLYQKLDFVWRYAYRFDENATRLHYIYQQIGVAWKTNDSLVFSFLYRHIYELNDYEEWVNNPNVLLECKKGGTFKKIAWKYRNRLQYNSMRHVWDDRNRLKIIFPEILPCIRFIFIEEIFYRLFQEVIQYRHRFCIEAKLKQNFSCSISYLIRDLKLEGSWKRRENILFLEGGSIF